MRIVGLRHFQLKYKYHIRTEPRFFRPPCTEPLIETIHHNLRASLLEQSKELHFREAQKNEGNSLTSDRRKTAWSVARKSLTRGSRRCRMRRRKVRWRECRTNTGRPYVFTCRRVYRVRRQPSATSVNHVKNEVFAPAL